MTPKRELKLIIPDELWTAAQAIAGEGKVSAWFTELAELELLREEIRREGSTHDRIHPLLCELRRLNGKLGESIEDIGRVIDGMGGAVDVVELPKATARKRT